MNDYYDTIQAAIDSANVLEYTNGMATETLRVERENSYVHVTRKCGSLDHPEIVLFKVVPKNDVTPDYQGISESITDSLGIYGDLEVDFRGDTIKTVVIGNVF